MWCPVSSSCIRGSTVRTLDDEDVAMIAEPRYKEQFSELLEPVGDNGHTVVAGSHDVTDKDKVHWTACRVVEASEQINVLVSGCWRHALPQPHKPIIEAAAPATIAGRA